MVRQNVTSADKTALADSSPLEGIVSETALQSRRLGLIELLDKDLQVSMLESALKRDRLAGTLLFFGPEGSGKSSLAFWLAAALNCTANEGPAAPCFQCNSCRKIQSLNHPDVFWIFPLPGNFYKGGHPDETKLAKIFEQKRQEPWIELQFTEKSEHHLAAVRRIRQEASRSCYEGRRKVFVITGADRLRIEAANAFLKLLEEPRANVTLILCSDRPASLLPTILSRCQRLQVTRPAVSTLTTLLESRFGIRAEEAGELLALADGSLAGALRMKNEDSYQAQKAWVDNTFQAVLEPGYSGCHALVDNRKGPMYNRGDFERYLAFLTQALRDSLLIRLGGPKGEDASPGSTQKKGPISRYADRVADSQALIKLINRMVNLRDELNRNVNLRLLGWSLLKDMKEVIGDGA